MTDDKITLFLMDDHQIVVEGIIALVSQDPCIQVVGHCNDGLELMDKLRQAKPDVLVLDISIPGLNGLDACRMVSTELPRTKVLMLTMHSNEQCVLDAFERGASGYLIKETVSQEFCEAVHAVARGGTLPLPEPAQEHPQPPEQERARPLRHADGSREESAATDGGGPPQRRDSAHWSASRQAQSTVTTRA